VIAVGSLSSQLHGRWIANLILGFIALGTSVLIIVDPRGRIRRFRALSRAFWARRNPLLARLATWGMSEAASQALLAALFGLAAALFFVLAALGV